MIGKVLLDLIMKKKLETTFSRFEFFWLSVETPPGILFVHLNYIVFGERFVESSLYKLNLIMEGLG